MLAIARASLLSSCHTLSHGNIVCRKRQHPLPHLAAFAAYVTPIHPANPHEFQLTRKHASHKNQKAAKTAMLTIPVNITTVSLHILHGMPLFLTPQPLRPPRFNSLFSSSVTLRCLRCLRCLRSSVLVLVVPRRRSLTPFRPSTYTDPRFLQRRCDAAPPPHLIGAQCSRAASAS